MSGPVSVPRFGPDGLPFNLDNLNAALQAIIGAVNSLSAEPLLQLTPAPGNSGAYLPITGGALQGELSAPSIVVGPAAGEKYAVVTKNDKATPAAEGIVLACQALADLSQSITNPPTRAEVQAIQGQLNTLLARMRTAGQLATS